MEPAGAWGPCQIQLANWTFEEEPPAASVLPVEYASIDIPSTFGLQAYVPQPWVTQHQHQQLVEYYEGDTQHDLTLKGEEQESFQVALHRMEMEMYHYTPPSRVFQEVVDDFDDGVDKMRMKMHRYPSSIRDLGDLYTMPRLVAIGPYHHDRQELKALEQVKHVAAYHCIMESDHTLREVYDAVVSAADNARSLYNKDVMARIGYDDFRHMMFFDACFLVQFMLATGDGDEEIDPSLERFIQVNRKVLRNDVMLLENQLPWGVVEAVLRFRHVSLTQFVYNMRGFLKNRRVFKGDDSFGRDQGYKPPHLLGLARHHIVKSRNITMEHDVGNIEGISFSVSAIELAEIGIKLRPNESITEVISMDLNDEGNFSAKLSLSPMSLTHIRAIWLVNMAALELCTGNREPEDSAVCSYLHLFSMLVHREEDVQELRTRGILEGAGLTNQEALYFFTRFQSLPIGGYCVNVMLKIEKYKFHKPIWIKGHSFFYKNKATIVAVVSTIVTVVTLLGTIIGILQKR